ncbi:bifunctional NAD(P)H-hydrate repair enzyme [Aliidongia dinghuensis]|uniref:Bifunctional NAD(P)H-hydrate repair enzyme n=1 Tax=Aliidongia dinghuensis TaxID=1867774 RepID=A0A8J3E630_9PROT|nr:NAD(P)H-hydrate dehydratase [Aliidongia dinghuensis]GGF40722.1 bifunctional NAD(P)H-hydrate repair enzyme [Aliidongia dinghuensis]
MALATALLTPAEMGEVDRRTIAGGTAGALLMERAGAAVAAEIGRRWTRRPVAVLCGPGNNGGDGFVVARRLAAEGWPVRLALLGERAALRGDAAHHAALWLQPVEPLGPAALDGAGLVVDALFGAGLSRPLDAPVAGLLAEVGRRRLAVVAVDVPSGLDGATGLASGAVAADLTVTFGWLKPGHLLQPGRDLCGETVLADIGLDPAALDALGVKTWANDPASWRVALPRLASGTHKYMRGHALVLGGWPMSGAGRLAARAAARAGAGLVTVAVPPAGHGTYAAAFESQIVRPLADAHALDALLADRRFTGLLLGPGAGAGGTTRVMALRLLAAERPCVLDADALTAFADAPAELFAAIRAPTVLTPHAGEFARLFKTSGDKLTQARAAAAESGAVLVLKGGDTVVAAPDGRAVINANAPPTLATGGTGDVLAGLIVGLLAQGMPAFEAAAAGVWLHGAAAATFGPGLIASDLPDRIPVALRRLGRSRA